MGDRNMSRSNVTSRLKNVIKETPVFCKVIEFIVCIVVVGLIVDPFNSTELRPSMNHAGIVYVSICGYILINAIIILCYLAGERQPKMMSITFSLVGGILCFASGVVIIYNWNNLHSNFISYYYEQYSNQMIGSGIFALLASVIFVIDVIVTNKYD